MIDSNSDTNTIIMGRDIYFNDEMIHSFIVKKGIVLCQSNRRTVEYNK